MLTLDKLGGEEAGSLSFPPHAIPALVPPETHVNNAVPSSWAAPDLGDPFVPWSVSFDEPTQMRP